MFNDSSKIRKKGKKTLFGWTSVLAGRVLTQGIRFWLASWKRECPTKAAL
jgi:hypothetical protein